MPQAGPPQISQYLRNVLRCNRVARLQLYDQLSLDKEISNVVSEGRTVLVEDFERVFMGDMDRLFLQSVR